MQITHFISNPLVSLNIDFENEMYESLDMRVFHKISSSDPNRFSFGMYKKDLF